MLVGTVTNIFMKTWLWSVWKLPQSVISEHASKDNFLFRWNFVISCGIVAMKVPYYSMLDADLSEATISS